MNGQGKLLIQYLRNADRLIIPVYQRNYDWKEQHCRKLYDDLCNTIRLKKKHHFFGGIVSVSDPMGSSSDYLIIDGQQRITTVTLLLLAMANLIKEEKVIPADETLYAQIIKRYLADEINPNHRKMKLKPIKGDQRSYERLWGDPFDYDYASNITQNYLYFYEQIQKQEITIDQLFSAVERLQIIDITLTPPDDDPQLVFESLNSTGLDLNEGDKIRNLVLMNLAIETQERYYDTYWNPIEKYAGYNRQNNTYDVSGFIRDYLSIKLRRIPGMKDVYNTFRDYAEKHGAQIESLLSDILAYAKRYHQLLEGQPAFPAQLKASIYRLNRFESNVTRPFLLEVLRLNEEKILDIQTVTEVFRTVEAYLLRRAICDLPSNALNKVFLTLCNDIRRLDGTYDQFLEKMRYTLANKKEKAAFPTDEEFSEGLRNKNIYAMPPRYKAYLFERFENGDSAEYKAIYALLDQGEYTIEHIMPQKLSHAWYTEMGDRAETIHDEWLHRLANLTLTAYNPKYGNASFQEKKTMQDGYLQSGIKMNQRIAQKDHWGMEELEDRNTYMTQSALMLWPYVDTAYAPPEKQYDEYALDDDASFTSRILVRYRFRGIEREAKSWIEMYIAVLKELHSENRTVLNYLADADEQVELSAHVARRADTIKQWEQIDENIYILTQTSTQYKVTLLQLFFEKYGEDPSNLIFFTEDPVNPGIDEAARYALRRKYWTKALDEIRKSTHSFQNVNPIKNNYTMGSTNKPGVYLSCVANFDCARVELYIDMSEASKNKALFDTLLGHKTAIEAAYGGALDWQRLDEKRACRICDTLPSVSIVQESDWPSMIAFHAEKSALLLRAVQNFLK